MADIRVGILTIREKWEMFLGAKTSSKTEDYLSKKFPFLTLPGEDNIWINGAICPNEELVNEIKKLGISQALYHGTELLALNSGKDMAIDFNTLPGYDIKKSNVEFLKIENLWDIFSMNGKAISDDFDLLTKNRTSQELSSTNKVLGIENIFIEGGAKVEFSILNATTGPIYIGKDAEIMEGSIVRGPFALGEHATLKMGAKIYGPTTIGPHSKVGGEVNNSVIFGFSNKAHDGFLGNSVIGEWCNIGADSNNSNLKNNYAQVKLWNHGLEKFENTGLTFCGLFMADHSKCGINTMFNTGTVVGVSANIFGSGFPRNFVPSFSWGGASGFSTYKLNDAFEVAKKVFERRELDFNETEKEILAHVFDITEKQRKS